MASRAPLRRRPPRPSGCRVGPCRLGPPRRRRRGRPLPEIAGAMGRHLGLPTASISPADAVEHFGFLGRSLGSTARPRPPSPGGSSDGSRPGLACSMTSSRTTTTARSEPDRRSTPPPRSLFNFGRRARPGSLRLLRLMHPGCPPASETRDGQPRGAAGSRRERMSITGTM